jgi:hypothetical protein
MGFCMRDSRFVRGRVGSSGLVKDVSDRRQYAHFLMVTFWQSAEAIRACAGDDISVAKNYDFDKDFLLRP